MKLCIVFGCVLVLWSAELAQAGWIQYRTATLIITGYNATEPLPTPPGYGLVEIPGNVTFPAINACAGRPEWSRLTQAPPVTQAHIAAQVGLQCFNGELVPDATLAADDVTELTTNQLCAATLAQISSRIADQQTAIQTDIDAATTLATARTAMTTMNTRYAAALQQIARCLNARARVRP